MYTLKIKFMVGQKAYDTVTGTIVKVLGTFYGNGKSPDNKTYFHEITYYTSSHVAEGVRSESQLLNII